MSIKDGRRAGNGIYCESARQRKELYPKRALKCKAEVREIFFYLGSGFDFAVAGCDLANGGLSPPYHDYFLVFVLKTTPGHGGKSIKDGR